MHAMHTATRAILLHFQTARVVSAVLNRGVIAFLTLGASQVNDWANNFLFGCHFRVAWLPLSSQPRFLHLLLFDNLRNLASTHGQAAFADGEFGTLLKSNLAD